MKRIVAICLAGAALAACRTGDFGEAPVTPPPPPPTRPAPPQPPPSTNGFDESAFAWSRGAGNGGILGAMRYGTSGAPYTCGDVVLLPETAWTQARMQTLYGSTEHAEVPVDEVRAHTPRDAADTAQSRASAAYARHATCNASNHFSYAHLPDGAWYMITVATPKAGGPKIALMKRVTSHGWVVRESLP